MAETELSTGARTARALRECQIIQIESARGDYARRANEQRCSCAEGVCARCSLLGSAAACDRDLAALQAKPLWGE